MHQTDDDSQIFLTRKKQYSICQQIFCCRCLECCQGTDESLLTSTDRKNALKQLIDRQAESSRKSQINTIRDPLEIIIGLYLFESKSLQHQNFVQDLRQCRINPSYSSHSSQREDVEFYIPQLCSYIAFHQEFRDDNLVSFMKQAGSLSMYFAHLLYFYIRSLSQIVTKRQSVAFKAIYTMTMELQLSFSQVFLNHQIHRRLSLTPNTKLATENQKDIMRKYGTSQNDEWSPTDSINPQTVPLLQYTRMIKDDQQSQVSDGAQNLPLPPAFQSTIDFFDDLIQVSESLKNADPKIVALRTFVKRINEALPAAVYIPFLTNQIRRHYVLNIVPTECRVFSTKERSPYYICLELFNPEDEHEETEEPITASSNSIRRIPDWRKQFDISRPITIHDHFSNSIIEQPNTPYERERRASIVEQFEKRRKSALDENTANSSNIPNSNQISRSNNTQSGMATPLNSEGISSAYEYPNTFDAASKIQPTAQKPPSPRITHSNTYQNDINIQNTLDNSYLEESSVSTESNQTSSIYQPSKELAKTLFGEEETDQIDRIRKKSPYGHFKSWKLVHFIVKTGDNLKQEQFAQQLIWQFDSIFKDSGLSLRLRPYEIVSLGPDCGIIEVVKNSVTIDSLKRKLLEENKQSITLQSFFKSYYGENLYQAQMNFCSSLAAYSLVCYFLQIKDRHNGNILLHREGYITHIDFGFLLSNAPGKGLAFENNVPFKLLTEYVDVLGGLDSEIFKTFRYLFFKGFQAARKHQDKILILVKMLYSSQGASLPCFEKGEDAISALQARFNPASITIDSETFVHTNELINRSLDNWKSRWYDKWQYFCQGIFY